MRWVIHLLVTHLTSNTVQYSCFLRTISLQAAIRGNSLYYDSCLTDTAQVVTRQYGTSRPKRISQELDSQGYRRISKLIKLSYNTGAKNLTTVNHCHTGRHRFTHYLLSKLVNHTPHKKACKQFAEIQSHTDDL